MSTPILTVENATLVRGDRCLIDGLSWQVCSNELWHVIGQNGIGKTTLLRALAGLIRTEAGKITLTLPESQREDRGIAFLGHELGLHKKLSVRENIQSSLVEFESVEKILIAFGFSDRDVLFDKPLGVLSSGQKKRVQLAIMMASNAKLWILDEPFTALDITSVSVLVRHIESHVRAGGSVILTSHQDALEAVKSDDQIRLKTLTIAHEVT